jgi:hypothetical protein
VAIAAGAAVLLLAPVGAPAQEGERASRPVLASSAEQDLALVKRATAAARVEEPPRVEERARAPRSGRPRWFKVRIVERGGDKGRVSVNLPLVLVRALDDVPIDFDCHGRRDRRSREPRCSIRLAEVLSALDAGQDLVEIEDEKATIRIWVE